MSEMTDSESTLFSCNSPNANNKIMQDVHRLVAWMDYVYVNVNVIYIWVDEYAALVFNWI